MISIVDDTFDAYGIVKEQSTPCHTSGILVKLIDSQIGYEDLEWLATNPKILEANVTLCRVVDDIATYDVEKSEGQIATRKPPSIVKSVLGPEIKALNGTDSTIVATGWAPFEDFMWAFSVYWVALCCGCYGNWFGKLRFDNGSVEFKYLCCFEHMFLVVSPGHVCLECLQEIEMNVEGVALWLHFLYWLPFYLRQTVVAGVQLSHKSAGILSTIFDIGGRRREVLAGVTSDIIEARGVTSIVFFFSRSWYSEPDKRARALATVSAIIDGTGSVGAAFGPLLAGYIETRGWNSVFVMLILSITIASLFLIPIVKNEIKGKLNEGKWLWISLIKRILSQLKLFAKDSFILPQAKLLQLKADFFAGSLGSQEIKKTLLLPKISEGVHAQSRDGVRP
ncbi:hypothetical protein HAX54_002677 [Datura stramonium]|uniref:Terpene synthase metal-binding domain-containing protein n=1 Tax=Datura stramonium TaxID=4076 RepID=A0ABS8RVC2_DATST|nr:hypothetical protein [Datura stramonium]